MIFYHKKEMYVKISTQKINWWKKFDHGQKKSLIVYFYAKNLKLLNNHGYVI